jgi:hypothetical protein
MLGIGVLVAVAVTWFSVKLAEWLRCVRLLSKLPGPRGHPLVGQLPVLASPQHHNTLAQWAAQFGGIYKMRLAHVNVRQITPLLQYQNARRCQSNACMPRRRWW